MVRLLERCDAFRKPARFLDIVLACECDARGRLGHASDAYRQRERLLPALQAARSVVTADIAAQAQARGLKGPDVGALIHRARVTEVAKALGEGALDRAP
ncbi:Multifunctional CCA protein [compost metagenome]